MSEPARIAFYAPLKPPDHPRPSGDRQMARMLFAALQRAGFEPFLASRVIAYSKRPDLATLEARRAAAHAEAERLLALWRHEGGAPALWFCYHPYDKAPDWLGLAVCEALAIPMVTAEPCRTAQGPNGEWLPWRAEARRGLERAALHLVMNDADEAYLRGFIDPARLVRMTPFLDPGVLEPPLPAASTAWGDDDSHGDRRDPACRLLAVGMLRPGAKLDSYRVLGAALAGLVDLPWRLVVAGGGPALAEAQAAFGWDTKGAAHGNSQVASHGDSQAAMQQRVSFVGECSPAEVSALMRDCDVLAWPGCREAYGMVYLEAAFHGKPVAALRNLGVPMVVEHGVGGLLADPPDAATYREVLRRLITDASLRTRLGAGAARHVREQRSADQAAALLRTVIAPLL